jgi:hypothetical protein
MPSFGAALPVQQLRQFTQVFGGKDELLFSGTLTWTSQKKQINPKFQI